MKKFLWIIMCAPPFCALAVVVETARDRTIEAVSDAESENTAVPSSPTTKTSTLTKDLGAAIVAPHSPLRFSYEIKNSQVAPIDIERVSIATPCCLSIEAPPKHITSANNFIRKMPSACQRCHVYCTSGWSKYAATFAGSPRRASMNSS
ncbi:MAG: hypothetical protein ACRC1K_25590, partial [Planctomycetia bacterium]